MKVSNVRPPNPVPPPADRKVSSTPPPSPVYCSEVPIKSDGSVRLKSIDPELTFWERHGNFIVLSIGCFLLGIVVGSI